MNRFGLIFTIMVTTAVSVQCQTPSFDRTGFASDFAVLVRTLRENHPKLKLIRERAAFDRVVQSVETKLPAYDRTDSYLGLMRVVASLEDGHTGIELASLGFRRYPIEVTVFDDGIYVTRTNATTLKALGWRLTRVGRVPIDDLVQRLRQFLTADNDMGRRQSLPPRLATHELLRAVGAANDEGAWFVGASDSVWVPRPEPGIPAFTHSARDTTAPLPDYLSKRTTRFWWKPVQGGPHASIMYAQLNTLAREQPPFADLVDSLFNEIEANAVSTLIIDIRNNGGGDGTLAKSLVQRIIRTPSINQRGRFYVITGRATFSAAVILAAALENETNAIFVGEPTGAPANHYGEPARTELANTKIRVAYSRLYWQNGDPRDARAWITPSIPVGLTFAEWRTNKDPAVETILALNGAPGRAVPLLKVAGTYPTGVTLLSDACGGSGVQPNPTIVEHTAGATSISLTHAGTTYSGTVRPDGTFVITRKTLSVSGVTYDIGMTGTFSGDGLRAIVTVGVTDPRRASPCQYTVLWTGARTSGFNVIPGR